MELPLLNQSPVVFHEENHTYTLDGKYLNGVTSTLVRRAYPNTYSIPDGFTKEQWEEKLRQAAANGTAIHQAIELYEDLGIVNDMPEVCNYISVKNDNGFVNLATEYIVSDEEHYASAIDHVWYQPDTNTIVIVDVKRTYEIHEPEVTCQTSVYKKFFLRQNPHLKDYKIITAVLWLRGEKYDFRILNPLTDDAVDALIAADLKDKAFDIQPYIKAVPICTIDVEQQVAMWETQIKELTAKYNELKAGLLKKMEEASCKKFEGRVITLTMTLPSKRTGFDTVSFKKDYPKLYERYKTTSDVKSSLKISVNKQ